MLTNPSVLAITALGILLTLVALMCLAPGLVARLLF
jgi:hypothetical protein